MNTFKLSGFESDEKNGSPECTLLFGGDFCPINRYEKKILDGQKIFDTELEKTFGNSDFSMINLEAPLCEDGLRSDSFSGGGLKADPKIAPFIKSLGVNAVGLANNHIRDFREAGVSETMQSLTQSRVLHTGAGMNLADAQRPISVDIRGLRIGIWALAEKELNVASETSAGSAWFRPETDVDRIRTLKEQFDFLVVFLHAGHEFISTPSPRIRDACRSFIDAGADVIVAHHPHVVQGVEKYRNGLIAYSLGNLVFDSPYVSRYAHTDSGYMLRLSISKHCIREAEIIPYRLRENIMVTSLDEAEFREFTDKFNELSGNITDDVKFHAEWERNVKFRWETEYNRVLNNLSKSFNDPANKDYAWRTKNLFACPTHVEMIVKSFEMLDEGKLSRSPWKIE